MEPPGALSSKLIAYYARYQLLTELLLPENEWMCPGSSKSTFVPTRKDQRTAPGRHLTRSGIYSWVNSKRLPRGRTFVKILKELSILREDLIQQYGGEKILPDVLILVDSAIEALGVQKLLGLYVRKYGVIDEESAKAGRLELNPILGKNWISFANTVRQALLALRELTAIRKEAGALNPLEIAALIDAENAEETIENQNLDKTGSDIELQNMLGSNNQDNPGGRGFSE